MASALADAPAETDSSGPFHFVEGARQAGLWFEQRTGSLTEKRYLIETISSGVVIADFNGDAHLDVYLVNGGKVPARPSPDRFNMLFFGDGKGAFRPGPDRDVARDPGFGVGAVAADYDRDGDLDLYLCNWGPNVLLRNRGDGTFEDVTATAGVGDPRWSASAAFGDVDGDGLLDLYVANYFEFGSERSMKMRRSRWVGLDVAPGPRAMTPEPDRLYRNRGDGTFEDVSASAGILAGQAVYSLAVILSDLDRDGWVDIYVASDSTRNLYWHNEGGGRFVDLGLESGSALSSNGRPQAGMGIAVADFNQDGLSDLVVTNFARDFHTYYEGAPGNTFEDRTFPAGLARATFPVLGFGVEAEDFDNDGKTDLFFANGHVYPNVDQRPMSTTYAQRDQVFRGGGDGTFTDQTEQAGSDLSQAAVGRGSAAGDLDGDGRIDLVVNNIDGPPHLLWNRTVNRNHWLAVRLRGKPGVLDRAVVGAWITVRAGERTWRREVRAGGSFASSSSAPLMFGLGPATAIDEVSIRLAGRELVSVRKVAVDRILDVELPP